MWIYFRSVLGGRAAHSQTKHPLCETHAASAASVGPVAFLRLQPVLRQQSAETKSIINTHKQKSDPQHPPPTFTTPPFTFRVCLQGLL